MEINDTSVEVLFDFEYPLKGGKKISIKEGERLYLIRKTNDDWWQVIRSTERRPFYVPSTYVREIVPARRSSTSSLGRTSDNKFTVSVKVKQKPSPFVKPRVSKQNALSSFSSVGGSKNGRDKDQRDNEITGNSELSDSDKRSGGYSIVRLKKTAPEYGEANILEEEQHLSESLTELARQITFRPALEPRHDFIRRLDGISHRGSLKTKHERRQLLKRQVSGSWPDITICDPPERDSRSMDNLESDSENNLVPDRPAVTIVTFPGNSDRSNNNWKNDDSDSEHLGSDITESSCESLNPTKYKPVAKPRRIYKQQEEVIYANCLELRGLENDDTSRELYKAPDSPKETLRESDGYGEPLREPASRIDIIQGPGTPKELIKEPGFTKAYLKGPKEFVNEPSETPKELVKESPEATQESIKEPSDASKEIIKGPLEATKELIKESLEVTKEYRVTKEFIRELENRTDPSLRQARSGSGDFEEEKGQIERNENEKSSDDTDWGRRFFKKDKRRKTSDKENENKKETENKAKEGGIETRETPLGWSTHVDTETQLSCYIHSASGKKWYSSIDREGRVYFYEEHGAESSWTLPDLTNTPSCSPTAPDHQLTEELSAVLQKISTSGVDQTRKIRSTRAISMIVPDKREEEVNVNKKWPQLYEGKMVRPSPIVCVLLEGPLLYTKISDGGKKVRKSWSSVYVILTELFILIYKDMKAFHSQKASPEVSIDLNGATVGNGQKISGRKYVILVSTLLGDHALQCENVNSAMHWATKIQQTIQTLPKGVESSSGIKFTGQVGGDCPEEPRKGATGISRSKSVNFKNKDDSMEDLGSTMAERQLKIKARLKKFFHKRPSMEHLVKKGIWKDEPVFGCFLEQACGSNNPRVPEFVQKCIACIEIEENMKTDGLYRASGNLSQIQKIRFQIDQHNYSSLQQEEDVHVLTGALKLFFRELKEPLIPYKLFSKAIEASTVPERKAKLKLFHDIVKALPAPNKDTLKCLLQHLLKVTKYKDSNRMHINNIAIVFGPTLMWPEHESADMALDMMQQNMVIETLLNDYDVIFK